MAGFQVHIVETRAEFDAAMDCQWAGFESPVEYFWRLWFPVNIGAHVKREEGPGRAQAIAESKDRLWNEHITDPNSTWIYITDDARTTEDGSTYCVACCQWRIYDGINPFAGGMPDIQCTAWPAESVGAKFCAKLARGIFTPRVSRFARPHIGLSWMAVRPEARQRGLGSILMEWGLTKADAIGLEGYIEASALGRILYGKHGFKQICEMNIDMTPGVEDAAGKAEWEALTQYYLPHGFEAYAMWRPARGDWNKVVDQSWKDGFEFWTASPASGRVKESLAA